MALKFLNNGYFAGKVGIGTDSPSSNLDIEDASGVTIDINSSSGDGMFRFQDDGTTKWAIGRDNTQQNFVFSNSAGLASDNVLTLAHSTGNVGIGTASPSRKLHIHADSGNAYLQLTQAATGTTSNDGFQISMGTGQVNFINRENGNMVFETNNTERMRITNTGNVGIGTTSPGEKLEVDGIIKVVHTDNSYANYRGHGVFFNRTENYIAPLADNTSTLNIGYNGAKWGNIEINGAFIKFENGPNEFMRISSSGNVGIGTSTPGNFTGLSFSDPILDVAGPIQSRTGNIALGGGSYRKAALFTPTGIAAPYLDFRVGSSGTSSNTTVRMRIDSSGNVGIGTTSPGYKLDISGSLRATGESTFTNNLLFPDNSRIKLGTSSDLQVYHNSADSYIENYTGNLTFRQRQDDGDIMFESDDGSGGTTPYFQLDGSHTQSIAWKNIHFVDGVKALFGDYASPDLQIYHDGSDSQINDTGTGNLLITSNGASVQINKGTTENMAEFIVDGAVKLYYDSVRKFETTSTGVSVTGGWVTSGVSVAQASVEHIDNAKAMFGNGNDLQIYHDGSNSYIKDAGTGFLNIQSDPALVLANGAGEPYFIATSNGSVKLYYDNSTKLTTGSVSVGTATATGGTLIDGWKTTTQANAINDTTIATTAYVNNKIALIPAGLVFQGTWNASTNTPTLTSGSGTTGHFYIVSTDGSTNLDGITDWKVGDWAVFVEQGASDQWEKVDNSSVLDGSGTGGSVAGWAGSGTSNTLTNAPITFSGNNTTFAGSVTGTNATFTAGTAASGTPLTLGSSTQTSYTLQQFQTSAHSSTNAYLIAYGAGHGSQAGNFAMKNIVSSGEIFFELASGVEPLRMTSTGSTFAGNVGVGMAPDSAVALTVSGQIGPTNGTAAAPTHTFYSDDDTGMYRSAANALSFSTSGTLALTLDSSQNATFAGTVLIDGVSNYTGLTVKGSGASRPAVNFTNATQGNLGTIFGTEARAVSIGTGTSGVIALTLDASQNATFAGDVNMASAKIESDGSAAAGAYLELHHNNNNSTDVCATINLTNNAGGYASIIGGTTGANNTGYIEFKTDNAGTQGTVLTLNGDNSATFAGDVNAGTGLRMYTDSSGNGVIYNLGQDKDLYFVGDDGGTGINALVFDMSEGGAATFAGDVNIDEQSLYLYNASSNYWRVQNNSSGKLVFKQGTTQRGVWSSGELELTNNLIVGGDGTFAGDVTATANYSAGNSKIIYKAQRSGGAVAGDWSYDDATTDMSLGTSTAHSFSLKTGNTRALTLDSSQNATFAGSVLVNGTNVTVANASNPYVYLNDTNAGAAIFQQEGNTTRIGSDSNTQVVLVQNNATAVTIDTSKNVGIGTTSPDTLLHIESTSDTSSPIFTIQNDNDIKLKLGAVRSTAGTAPDSTFIAYDGDLRFIADADSTTEVVRIDSSGNVGIGTTSPDAKLHIVGDGDRLEISSADYDLIKMGAYGDSGADLDNGFLNLSLNGSEKIRLLANGTSYFNGGNVGIGTTSPAAKLEVDSSTAPQILVKNTSGGDAKILFEDSSGVNQNASITFNESGQNTFTIATGYQSSSNANRINIAPAGHVALTAVGGSGGTSATKIGIGTTSPGAKLDVTGNYGDVIKAVSGSQSIVTNFVAPSGGSGLNNIISTGGEFNIGTSDAQSFSLATGSVSRVSILSGGNVGIGTTSPYKKLTVSGDAAIEGLLQVSAAAPEVLLSASGGAVDSRILNDGAGNLIIGHGTNSATPTERFRINSSGNVGINVTNPNARLNVNGGIKIEGTNSLSFGGSASIPSWAINSSGSDLIIDDQATTSGSVLFNNSEGVALPRLTTTQINAISSPTQGLMAYNTTLNTICFYNGSSWQKVSHTNM